MNIIKLGEINNKEHLTRFSSPAGCRRNVRFEIMIDGRLFK